MKERSFRRTLLAAAVLVYAGVAMGTAIEPRDPVFVGPDGRTGDSAPASAEKMNPPLENWMAPQILNPARGVSGTLAGFGGGGVTTQSTNGVRPAASWEVKTFVPITPCRLVDTRGVFSPVYAGGAFAAGETRVYRAAGNCGVTPGTNRIDAVSLAITTPPTAASGDIEAVSNAATLGNTVAMVIQSGQWNSVTVVTQVDANGDFKVQLRGTAGHVVIDINGYYASLDSANSDYLSVIGSYPSGGMFYVVNSNAGGGAVRAVNSGGGSDVMLGSGDNAIDVISGRFRVRGAGVGTSTLAYVHRVTAANSCIIAGLPRTVLNHPDLNGNPNAIVLAGAGMYAYPGGGGLTGSDWDPFNLVYYLASTTCGSEPTLNRWMIYKTSGAPAFVINYHIPLVVFNPSP